VEIFPTDPIKDQDEKSAFVLVKFLFGNVEQPEYDGYKQRIQQNGQNSPDACVVPYSPGCQCAPDEESQPGILKHALFP